MAKANGRKHGGFPFDLSDLSEGATLGNLGI
jgi:hypothetical protein